MKRFLVLLILTGFLGAMATGCDIQYTTHNHYYESNDCQKQEQAKTEAQAEEKAGEAK